MTQRYVAPSRQDPQGHRRGHDKLANIPVKVQRTSDMIRKPAWIRAKAHTSARVTEIKKLMREKGLHSVCEEASCPNLGECFSHGTATFMIMGDICTRRCPFCDVANGRPNPLNPQEPVKLAAAIAEMALSYVVITSVDRDMSVPQNYPLAWVILKYTALLKPAAKNTLPFLMESGKKTT